MTLQEMHKTATARTEAVIGAWTERPTGQTKRLIDNYRKAFIEIEKELKDIYAKFLSGVKPEDYYNEMLKFNRAQNLQKQIVSAYNEAARKAGAAQMEISKTAISNQYYGNMYSVNWFSGTQGNTFYTVLNPNIAKVSVFGTPEVWKGIKKADKGTLKPFLPKNGTVINNLRANRTKDLIKLQDTITQGLIQGKSFTALSKDIKAVFNTTANNAVRIARTEGIRNMNSGALANTQEAMSAGVGIGREVVEIMDDRTRAQSASINGQRQKGDDPFIYPGGLKVDIIGNSGVPEYDINERGTSVDFIEGIEPTTIEGINPATGNPGVASYRDFDKWMEEHDLRFNKEGRIVSKGKTAF
jgi:hypothetical protein